MNPKLCKRLVSAEASDRGTMMEVPVSNEKESAIPELRKTSLRDQAALLLSIADIAKSEIGSNGLSALWADEDEDISRFPHLPSNPVQNELKCVSGPRTQSLTELLACTGKLHYPSNRIRSVSIDSPGILKATTSLLLDRTSSPLFLDGSSQPISTVVTPMQSPVTNRLLPLRKPSLRLSFKAKHEYLAARSCSSGASSDEDDDEEARDFPIPSAIASTKTKSLQRECPKGIPIKKILRRKFSWKNYPELEQFLIVNREEYLRHSALNYTVQQKQYNNRLTERLLELATEHGYVFDEKEFSFVTVRDRIRCYYKSFVQSAKKRGILMGYAARKAGLLNEDDLEKEVGDEGRIFSA